MCAERVQNVRSEMVRSQEGFMDLIYRLTFLVNAQVFHSEADTQILLGTIDEL